MKITVYGSRGSIPLFCRNNLHYGGNTMCVKLETDGQVILLDCGSGMAQFINEALAESDGKPEFDILLSHLHLDHIIGLSSLSLVLQANGNVRIFTKSRNAKPLAAQIFGIFKPPYWPVSLETINKAEFIEISGGVSFSLGEGITVTPFDSEHPDGTTAFRIDADKSLVYLLDYELNSGSERFAKLTDFCKNADVIMFDATYMPGDYDKRRRWGHSTYLHGIELAEASSCAHMVLTHFSQEYSDKALDALANELKGKKTRYSLAFDGMELEF